MEKKRSESDRRERQRRLSEKHTRMRTNQRQRELVALLRMGDDDIDTSDIPEVTDWSRAVVGRFHRPLKEQASLRLDVDILASLRAEGPGYQTRINAILREFMALASEHRFREGNSGTSRKAGRTGSKR